MTTFSADPGTWLVSLDPDFEPIPIIGWEKGPGARAWPILPMDKTGFLAGEAIRLPGSGAIVDPMWKRTFASEEAWRVAYDEEEPYEQGRAEEMAKPATKPVAKKVSSAKVESDPEFTDQLAFGSKRLKNRSFWHCDSDNPFVFVIDGGKTLPTGENVNKITRDEFYNLRGMVTETVVDPDNLPESEDADADDDEDLI